MRVNLLPKEERPLRQSQVRWEFLVVVIGTLLLATVVTFSWLEMLTVQDLKNTVQEVQSRELALQKQVITVQNLRKEILNLETIEKGYKALLGGQNASLSNLETLTQQRFPSLWIEALILEDNKVTVQGYTRDMTSLSLYLNWIHEISEKALLQKVSAQGNTGFYLFSIEVWGESVD